MTKSIKEIQAEIDRSRSERAQKNEFDLWMRRKKTKDLERLRTISHRLKNLDKLFADDELFQRFFEEVWRECRVHGLLSKKEAALMRAISNFSLTTKLTEEKKSQVATIARKILLHHGVCCDD